MTPRGQAAEIADVLARARQVAGVTEVPALSSAAAPPAEETRHAPGAGKAGAPPEPAAGAPVPAAACEEEAHSGSPEDVGFLTPEQRASSFEDRKEEAPTPRHRPSLCGSCSAEIFWAQLLDERGERIRREDGRFKAMPVDAEPAPDGNVVIFHRPSGGIVGRVLKKGEQVPLGARLRRSHFSTCPNAKQHRRTP